MARKHLNPPKLRLREAFCLFRKEEKDWAYEAYSSFDRSMRSLSHYIINFEQRYSWMCKYKMELLDAVLAFKPLDAAGLDMKDQRIALTACPNLTFASWKLALDRIFGEETVC